MNHAADWTVAIAFGVVWSFLVALRDRLKRIEEKLDRLSKSVGRGETTAP